MSDIVEMLRRCDVRSCGADQGKRCITRKECEERNAAADEIERLRARVEELEELRDWVLLYDDAIKEDNDADVVFHDMVKSARALTD